MAHIDNGDYTSGAAGRGYIGLFKDTANPDNAIVMKAGDKYKGIAKMHQLVLIQKKASGGTKFPVAVDVGSFFYVAQRQPELTLAQGDEGVIFRVTKDWPLVSANIELSDETQEVLTQLDDGIPKKIKTGKTTSEINVTVQLRKGDTIIKAFQSIGMNIVKTSYQGNITVDKIDNSKFVLFLKDLDGQEDTDSGVVCLVEPTKRVYTFDATALTSIEIPMSLASGANITMLEIAQTA